MCIYLHRKIISSTQEIHLNDVTGIQKKWVLSSGKLLVSVTKENLGHKPEIKQYWDYNLKKTTLALTICWHYFYLLITQGIERSLFFGITGQSSCSI